MNCADIEILICDYVDGTLAADERAEVERHFAECPACAQVARDSAAAVAFIERAADVEPPPELVTRILFDAPWSKAKGKSKARSFVTAVLSPILTPKYAMGMAMTILSLSMLVKWVAPVRPQLSDLQPKKVWTGFEDRAVRAWARSVKFYESLKLVYSIQTTLREWQQQDEDQRPAGRASAGQADEHKLPVRSAPSPSGTTPGGTPSEGPPGQAH